jgi:hypothetical protein
MSLVLAAVEREEKKDPGCQLADRPSRSTPMDNGGRHLALCQVPELGRFLRRGRPSEKAPGESASPVSIGREREW